MITNTLFAPLPEQTRQLLEEIPALIDKTFPLPARFRSGLPKDVAELSRLLTSGRGERGLSYLGRPNLLSAYLRFFLPWNLYRLCRLLPGLDLKLAANDTVTDLGCGPMTFAAALWICRPDLRPLPLEFRCIDRSGPALEAGKKFFAELAGENSPWNIHAIKSDLSAAKPAPAALVCAVNVFNEMHGDIARIGGAAVHDDAVNRAAERSARLLAAQNATALSAIALSATTPYANPSAVLVVEPGIPRCGEFISLLRSALAGRGYQPISPCPHGGECPFPGGITRAGKQRWCHFAFETDDAPTALHRLSLAARIPKERAVLSFLYAGVEDKDTPSQAELRVISDAFPLPQNRLGRYCCSQQGLVLLAGERAALEETVSGTLASATINGRGRDPRSGALLAEL